MIEVGFVVNGSFAERLQLVKIVIITREVKLTEGIVLWDIYPRCNSTITAYVEPVGSGSVMIFDAGAHELTCQTPK